MLQHYDFVSIENWVNFLNFAIFEFWAYYLELNIREIFNIHKFLTFGLVNENWKIIQFLIIDNFKKLEKIEFNLKLGKIQFSKIENRQKMIWPLGARTIRSNPCTESAIQLSF